MTWPRDESQQPINAGDGKVPLFPLGHGLTYGAGPGPTPTPSPTPTPTPSPTPSPTASPTSSPTPTPTQTVSPPVVGCRVTYTPSQWQGGFTAAVSVRNLGATAVSGWTLRWTWGGGQRVTSAWNATVTQTGTAVTATPAGHNATIPAGGTADFGFQGTWTGSNPSPGSFTLNSTTCTVG